MYVRLDIYFDKALKKPYQVLFICIRDAKCNVYF